MSEKSSFWAPLRRTLYFLWLPTNTVCCLMGAVWDHSGSLVAPWLGFIAIANMLTFTWAYRNGQYDRALADFRSAKVFAPLPMAAE